MNCGHSCAEVFRMFEGYYGPYFTPSVDADGNLTWTNNAGLPDPAPINIKGEPGTGLEISGLVATEADLPATAEDWTCYLVGTEVPYTVYTFNPNTGWMSLGELASGPKGDPGDNGVTFTPAVSAAGIISWTNDGDLPNPQPVDIKGPAYTLTEEDKAEIVADVVDEIPLVDPDTKTAAMTQSVGVDANGKLWTAPGGQGGTGDYPQLTNKPQINGVELLGNKTAAQLGLATPSDIPTVPTKTSDLTNDSGFVDASGAAAAAPVQSVNGQTGNVAVDGLSQEAKEALMDCFANTAWAVNNGQTYYDALASALGLRVLASIAAVFSQGSAVIYDTDSLGTLKQYLVVTATYSDSTTATVTDYTLSGTLTAGTSTITVSYGGKTTTFSVIVTHEAGVFSVTNNLTGATNSNSATSVTEGNSYSGTITANAGYTLTGATVSITMGGTDITSTAYNNGAISVASVTGALVIAVSAAAVVLSSISAVYTQSGTVYDTDSLNSLKDDLVVTATYSDSSTATVPSADYTLSGTLSEGISTITVTYQGQTTTFTVTVTAADNVLYSLENHTFNNSNPIATGVYPLTTDKDITFAFDVDFAGQQSGAIWKLFACINGTSPWSGLAAQGYSQNSNFLQIQNMANKVVVETDMRNYVGNFKYIVTHAIGSGQWHYYYKIGSNNVVDDVITNAFVAINGQVTIGGTASASQVFNGTVKEAKIYSKVLTSSEITAFMG